MGFLKKVLGTGDTTLALRVDADRVTTGESVTLHWDVGGTLDDKVRGLRVGVTATAHWLERDDDHDHDHDGGVSFGRDDRSFGDDHVEHRSAVAWEATRDLPAQLGAGSETFAIPPDAPPGSKDVLKWEAWVTVDREKGRDHREAVTLYVRRPAVEDPPTLHLEGDGLAVSGVPEALRLGASYPGVVRLQVPEAVKGTLRVVLVRRVRHVSSRSASLGALTEALSMPKLPGTDLLERAGVGGDHVITRQEEALELDLSGGKREWEPGRPHELPFELEVPRRGPTTAHDHAQVDWRIVVKVDRTMRGDLRVAAPVDVS